MKPPDEGAEPDSRRAEDTNTHTVTAGPATVKPGPKHAASKSGVIEAALKELRDRGIAPNLTAESYQSIAAAGFDRRTLPASFVLAQILQQEHPMSVRHGLYRAASAGFYPGTDNSYYKQCGRLILKLRRAGIIPYSWVADSLRTRRKPSSWSGLQDFADTVREAYRKDFWAAQSDYLEIVTEKDSMAGTIRPVTDEYDIHLNVIRGNCSESHVWAWAEALRGIRKPLVVLYVGDFDPNGLDIERDLRERLAGFLGKPITLLDGKFHPSTKLEPHGCYWQRLAVTLEDFRRPEILGFPVRKTKSKAWKQRCADYVVRFGNRCVEADAVPASEIRDRVRHAIESHIDQQAWERLKLVEAAEKETIGNIFNLKVA
jgi:hypothetical protein